MISLDDKGRRLGNNRFGVTRDNKRIIVGKILW
jgi:hypothetical protein